MIGKRLFGVVKGHREHIVDHTGRLYSDNEVADLLNNLHEENIAIKQLIYTMLRQMNTEKIDTEDARYSARIVFTGEEFRLMRKIWKGDLE